MSRCREGCERHPKYMEKNVSVEVEHLLININIYIIKNYVVKESYIFSNYFYFYKCAL